MSQLTLEDALAQRDAALERVQRAADPDWCDRALEAIRQTCLLHEQWHVDLVWEQGLDEPAEARALGPVMLRALRAGWCVKTDRVRPSVRSHGSGKPVFRYLLYRAQA